MVYIYKDEVHCAHVSLSSPCFMMICILKRENALLLLS